MKKRLFIFKNDSAGNNLHYNSGDSTRMAKIKIKCLKCGKLIKLDFNSTVAVCKECR